MQTVEDTPSVPSGLLTQTASSAGVGVEQCSPSYSFGPSAPTSLAIITRIPLEWSVLSWVLCTRPPHTLSALDRPNPRGYYHCSRVAMHFPASSIFFSRSALSALRSNTCVHLCPRLPTYMVWVCYIIEFRCPHILACALPSYASVIIRLRRNVWVVSRVTLAGSALCNS